MRNGSTGSNVRREPRHTEEIHVRRKALAKHTAPTRPRLRSAGRKAYLTIVALLSLLPLGAGAQSESSAGGPSVRAAIDAGNAAYIAAFAKGDSEALARVYDPNGTRLVANGNTVRGRTAIADQVRRILEQSGPIEVTIDTVELWVVDDLAYETGKWTYSFTPPGQSKQTIGGRYVTIWKRQPDGGWKIFADMGVPGTSAN